MSISNRFKTPSTCRDKTSLQAVNIVHTRFTPRLIILLTLLVFSWPLYAAPDAKKSASKRDTIANVVAVVGNIPITNFDLANETAALKKRRGWRKDKRDIKSQVLDLLISRAIVDFIAQQESVTVSQERVENHIKKEMGRMGIKNEKTYWNLIYQRTRLRPGDYKRETKRRLKTQQVVQLRVSVPNPTPSQIQEYYKIRGKREFPPKVLVRMVRMRYKKGNTKDEYRVSKLCRSAHAMARRNFAGAAKKYSDDGSKGRGGLLGWQHLHELAGIDPILAGAVNNTRTGTMTQRFNGDGACYFAKVESRKAVPIDDVYEIVRAKLYAQNEEAAFAQWVKQQRKRVSVNVFLDKYQEL